MKIIGTTFEKLPRERLVIGFEGENLRATVRIDCASVFAEYPNATPTLIVKPLFADAYPVVVDRNGTDVDWLITSEILSFSGDGEIQLVFYKDQVICKSAVSKIRVCRSLTVTGEMPDPVVQWIENANRKLAEVDAQIVELEGMVDTATDAATRAEQSESNATTAAANAATSAATASTKAAEAQASANTATAKASEAALSATQARNSAMSAANSESGATAKAAEAAQSAQTAAQKAEQITDAAQIATGKAEEASASATAAQTSATDAASSATAASASETAAKASETAASTSATQAAQSAQGASTDAQTATQKATEASQSATNAAASATNAATSAETASTKAGEAAQSAHAVAETAEQLADSLEQIAQNTQDIAELDERKANIDGYYPDMTVGNAEQLNSSKFVENSEPYTLRTSGGTSDIGNREYLDAVVGGTLAWNQLIKNGDFSDGVSNWGKTDAYTQSVADGIMTITTTDQSNLNYGALQVVPLQSGHTYLKMIYANIPTNIYLTSNGELYEINGTGTWKTYYVINKTKNTSNYYLILRCKSNETLESYSAQIKTVMYFDLTQMFGTAVADYIYNLETATAGAGVALFRSWFPNDYYEYNAGELLSVEGLQSHDMVGFNQWDEEVRHGYYNEQTGAFVENSAYCANKNPIPAFPNTVYYGTEGSTYVDTFLCYDSGMNYLGTAIRNADNTRTTRPNTAFINFRTRQAYGGTYKHDICISLAHNGSRNGEYEPYEKHSYPLDSSVILRGIPKVGANGVYWDGDRYLPDGTVERRYGVVDLGTLNWSYNESSLIGVPCFYTGTISSMKKGTSNIICLMYESKYHRVAINGNMQISPGNNTDAQYFVVRNDAYTDAAAFKSAMSGIYLVYELATPTTETAQPYHSTQWVSDWGTEEFVSTGLVPVGSETRYPQNLRDKLQHLPSLAGLDGKYIISQSGTDMTLVPYESGLPTVPSANGSYVLKCTVTNGVASYSWVAS